MKEFIENSIKEVISSLEGGYTVLLESDIVGLFFYALLNQENVINNQVHLDTRIVQSPNIRDKVDLVIGDIDYTSLKKPSINPEFLFELKCIPEYGFDNTQKDKRIGYIKSDIVKISKYNLKVPRFIVAFDGVNFLESEMKTFKDYRDNHDAGIVIIRIFKKNNKWGYETI